jgi:hypothetical protein
MNPKEMFKLAVRILGLVFLYHGLSDLPTVFLSFTVSVTIRNFVMGIVMIAWQLAIAWWLIGGASCLVHRAYPETGAPDTRV